MGNTHKDSRHNQNQSQFQGNDDHSLRGQLRKAYPKKEPSPSILASYTQLSTIRTPESDGDTHINVMLKGKTELGRKLAPEFNRTFQTMLGTFPSMAVYMLYLNTENFPEELLANTNTPLHKRVKEFTLKKVNVPNYWALLVEGMYLSISQDYELRKEIVENTLAFTSYHYESTTIPGLATARELHATAAKGYSITYHHNLIRYVGIIEELAAIFKTYEDSGNEKLVTEAVIKLIEEAKDKPAQGLLEGLPKSILETLSKYQTSAPAMPDTTDDQIDGTGDTDFIDDGIYVGDGDGVNSVEITEEAVADFARVQEEQLEETQEQAQVE